MEQIKNEKTFFHVFPTLKVEEEFKVLFADVEVKKITTNSGRDFLHVHLKSHHLIPKKKIRQMEQRIMSIVPWGILLYLRATSAEYMAVLYTSTAGRGVMTVCLGLYLVAWFWGKQITDIQV